MVVAQGVGLSLEESPLVVLVGGVPPPVLVSHRLGLAASLSEHVLADVPSCPLVFVRNI